MAEADARCRSARSLQTCHSCGSTDIVTDVSQGDVICRGCGMVLQDRIIDDSPDWNNYSTEAGQSSNKSRVGNSTDPNLGSFALDTHIGNLPSNSKSFGSLNRTNSSANKTYSESLSSYYSDIKKLERFAELMNLSKSIVDGASRTIALLAKESAKMHKKDAIVAAVIYITCRQEGYPRTLKEIAACTGVEKKQLGKYFIKISNVLKLQLQGTSTVSEYANRFCSLLNLPMKTTNMAEVLAHKSNEMELFTGKNPGAVAGAIVYIAAAITQSHRTISDITNVGSLCDDSVKKLCRQLNDHREKLLEKVDL